MKLTCFALILAIIAPDFAFCYDASRAQEKFQELSPSAIHVKRMIGERIAANFHSLSEEDQNYFLEKSTQKLVRTQKMLSRMTDKSFEKLKSKGNKIIQKALGRIETKDAQGEGTGLETRYIRIINQMMDVGATAAPQKSSELKSTEFLTGSLTEHQQKVNAAIENLEQFKAMRSDFGDDVKDVVNTILIILVFAVFYGLVLWAVYALVIAGIALGAIGILLWVLALALIVVSIYPGVVVPIILLVLLGLVGIPVP